MASEADPLRAASRWRPRPARLRCLRPSGDVELYAVPEGRRAWSTLRKHVPADVIEVVGEDASAAIVGRWASSSAAAAIAAAGADAADEVDDEPPSEEAANFRWLLRETRSLYADQLRAFREALGTVTDALRVQRDTFAQLAGARVARPAPTDDDDDDDGDGFAQVSSLLRDAFRLVQAERAAGAGAGEPGPPIAPITPLRETPP
jgi:hypothetical protein